LRKWLDRFDGQLRPRGRTGWRFIVEDLHSAAIGAQLAEPAELSPGVRLRTFAETPSFEVANSH
jgi:hypothetical protein